MTKMIDLSQELFDLKKRFESLERNLMQNQTTVS